MFDQTTAFATTNFSWASASQPQDELHERNLLASFEEEVEEGQFADIFEDNLDFVTMETESLPSMMESLPSLDFFQANTVPSPEKTKKKAGSEGAATASDTTLVKPDMNKSSSMAAYYCGSSLHSPPQDSLISLTRNARKKRKPAPEKKMKLLPESFEPTKYTILCGKGNDNYNWTGKYSTQ
jgi:hypothetical protein